MWTKVALVWTTQFLSRHLYYFFSFLFVCVFWLCKNLSSHFITLTVWSAGCWVLMLQQQVPLLLFLHTRPTADLSPVQSLLLLCYRVVRLVSLINISLESQVNITRSAVAILDNGQMRNWSFNSCLWVCCRGSLRPVISVVILTPFHQWL